MSDWTGYVGDWRFAEWENEVFTVQEPPVSGRPAAADVTLATNVRAKANREKGGLMMTEAGVLRATYERRFYFAASYTDGAGATKDPRNDGGEDLLAVGNRLVSDDGRTWYVTATATPGGADEHYEVDCQRSSA